jgi:hypothetical protein
MAAGRLVVGYLGEEVVRLMPERPPIVDADPSCFSEVMDQVLREPDLYAALAASGPEYVARWHSGAQSAAALQSFLS